MAINASSNTPPRINRMIWVHKGLVLAPPECIIRDPEWMFPDPQMMPHGDLEFGDLLIWFLLCSVGASSLPKDFVRKVQRARFPIFLNLGLGE